MLLGVLYVSIGGAAVMHDFQCGICMSDEYDCKNFFRFELLLSIR